MPVHDIYSRRKRWAEQTEPDVYQYGGVPDALRNQIRFIWEEAIGPYYEPRGPLAGIQTPPRNNNEGWMFVRNTVVREKGLPYLCNNSLNAKSDCIRYLMDERDTDGWIDLVEFSFYYVDRVLGSKYPSERQRLGITLEPAAAIEELNFRFREAGVGYRFENGQIVRVDAEFVHSQVVKPTLLLLSDPRFAGAQEEFLSAHAHYRTGEHKDAITDALNAFESTMKAISDIKGWEYPRGARAADLIKIIRANGLLPDYLDGSFDQLIATLKSGLPKVRNEEGGHGQGAEPRETPAYVAAYALHLAAANIVLLVEALKESEGR